MQLLNFELMFCLEVRWSLGGEWTVNSSWRLTSVVHFYFCLCSVRIQRQFVLSLYWWWNREMFLLKIVLSDASALLLWPFALWEVWSLCLSSVTLLVSVGSKNIQSGDFWKEFSYHKILWKLLKSYQQWRVIGVILQCPIDPNSWSHSLTTVISPWICWQKQKHSIKHSNFKGR